MELQPLDAFEAFIKRPENTDRTFEFISGEIVEVPSNPYVSKIAAKLITFIGMYLLSNDIGHVTGEAGGYQVGSERYAPDVAFISYARQPELATQGYNPHPPELAVEVISDTANSTELTRLRRKIANYLAAGTVVWVVNPADRVVEVYRSGAPVRLLTEHDTLNGTDILPEFQVLVQDIFPNKTFTLS